MRGQGTGGQGAADNDNTANEGVPHTPVAVVLLLRMSPVGR